jgi:tripartite-type tricarboxylate transporter receptor subunit TctC
MPDVKKRLSDLNLNAQSSSPEQAAEALASDIKRWQEVIAKAKIEKQ